MTWRVNVIFEVLLILIIHTKHAEHTDTVQCCHCSVELCNSYSNTLQDFTQFSNKFLGVKDKKSFTSGETLGSSYHNRNVQNTLEKMEETKCISLSPNTISRCVKNTEDLKKQGLEQIT